MTTCKECGHERDCNRGDGRLRSLCRLCWNKFCRENRKAHIDYFSKYINAYTKEKRKDKKFRELNNAKNNKSNKKAIAELSDLYVKNRLMNGKKYSKEFDEYIDIKRAMMIINRKVK